MQPGTEPSRGAGDSADHREELRRIVESRDWYHTLELAPGVVTPGWFDCRPVADRVLPPSCAGLRCLDIGAFDGFWGFEMERRGAAEVIAVDILDESRWDWPAVGTAASRAAIERRKGRGDGFLIARDELGSRVHRVEASIYELDPGEHGEYDLVYLGSLLLHLRDPVKALEAVRSVCRGTLVAVDAISLSLSLLPLPVAHLDGIARPYWWKPNTRGFARMLRSAGFAIRSGPRPFLMPPGPGMPRPAIGLSALRSRAGRELVLGSRRGDPHARIVAGPRPDL